MNAALESSALSAGARQLVDQAVSQGHPEFVESPEVLNAVAVAVGRRDRRGVRNDAA